MFACPFCSQKWGLSGKKPPLCAACQQDVEPAEWVPVLSLTRDDKILLKKFHIDPEG